MTIKKNLIKFISVIAFSLALVSLVFGDTVRLKDGSVIKGKIIGFRDGQFIILIGSDSKGRQRQMSFYSDEVESIEFDNSGTTSSTTAPVVTTTSTNNNRPTNTNTKNPTNTQEPIIVGKSNPTTTPNNSNTNTKPPTTVPNSNTTTTPPTTTPKSNPRFFNFNVKVLADNTANGWTNAGLVVKRGQRLKVTASGRISLGNGRFATPSGVSSLPDGQKLLPTEPTGSLIAVIGDDNNDFIYLGSSREFIAQRDGMLFLGINEGNLDDNSGAFDVTIEAEAGTSPSDE